METIDLHEYDEIWQAPKLIVFAGTYERTWGTFGGSQNKSPEQKQKILICLYHAVQMQKDEQIAVLSKILENGYGVQRSTLPSLLIEYQASMQIHVQTSA